MPLLASHADRVSVLYSLQYHWALVVLEPNVDLTRGIWRGAEPGKASEAGPQADRLALPGFWRRAPAPGVCLSASLLSHACPASLPLLSSFNPNWVCNCPTEPLCRLFALILSHLIRWTEVEEGPPA